MKYAQDTTYLVTVFSQLALCKIDTDLRMQAMHFMRTGAVESEEVRCSSDSNQDIPGIMETHGNQPERTKHVTIANCENAANIGPRSADLEGPVIAPPALLEKSTSSSLPCSDADSVADLSVTSSSAGKWPSIGGGRPFPPSLPKRDPYAVDFDGPNDPTFPQNWSSTKKTIICCALNLSAVSISIASATFAEGIDEVMNDFNVGTTVATLGTSFFVLGFSAGPVIWGPLSELYGRKPILVVSAFGMLCFSVAAGAGKDIQTVLISRFFSGFMGASPLVAAPAAMADMYSKLTRGMAMIHFGWLMLGASMLGPTVGGFTVKNSGLGWRFCSYISAIIEATVVVALVFFEDETHHGIILSRKADKLRKETGNWGIYAPHELVSLSLKEICEKTLQKPLRMLYTEPILLLLALYIAFIYGLMYMYLTAIPLIFSNNYGFSQGVAQLPYIAMFIGVLAGAVLLYFMEKGFVRKTEKEDIPKPEERLPPMMCGGIFFAIGLFWLGWAGSYPNKIHWIVPTLGAVPLGAGIFLVFIPTNTYIIDCYLLNAASALAGNTFLRSIFGGTFPLFAKQMFENMGYKWASTLLGCVALVLVPVPFAFYKYGKLIRAKSKYAL